MADVIAAGDVGQRLATITARDRLEALVRCQLGRAAKQRAMSLRALAALTGAGNDQVSFEFGEASRHLALASWQRTEGGIDCTDGERMRPGGAFAIGIYVITFDSRVKRRAGSVEPSTARSHSRENAIISLSNWSRHEGRISSSESFSTWVIGAQ